MIGIINNIIQKEKEKGSSIGEIEQFASGKGVMDDPNYKGVIKEEDKTPRDALIEISEGDARKLTNIMQTIMVTHKPGTYIEVDDIYSMAAAAKPKEVKEVLELAAKGNFSESRKKLLYLMLEHGLSGTDILKQVQKEVWQLSLNDKQKVQLIDKCGEVEFRIVEGSDEYLQLESFLAFVCLVGSNNQ